MEAKFVFVLYMSTICAVMYFNLLLCQVSNTLEIHEFMDHLSKRPLHF